MLHERLRGIMAGRHRAPKRQGWLVCPSLGMLTSYPSNLRECENCGAQVLTAVGSCTALVDAGTLDPQCIDCWLDAGGKTLQMHPDIEAELDALGLRDQGWRRLGELNTQEEF